MSARSYEFRSVWDVAEPPDLLWHTLEQFLEQDDPLPWWDAVRVTAHRGEEIDLVARSVFGYRLRFTVYDLELEPTSAMRFRSRGDLEGSAALSFEPGRPGRTDLTIDWHVDATAPWMRRSERVLRPVFVLAHDQVMKSGERRLNRWLQQRG
ncbi:hypothetical protein [Aeromicrobium duanguangcaii]|uniref:Polyketide cyclase / dehydrase and lipid transport n=1 Tax=Aeromicrobium duanguangcaii TaxID=2968086 RepID=A0ABY5KDH5_9ACTN|nr:hypothetical protein [Aeromicrobium duanguangcaii]MCD9152858.1 hypothetical protein [Aeromicrobium duanguangcaii]UUI67162.1 hypothetical protein NP095_08040 [Aeromicrobium duanguangcaii]